ncbi:MAG: thiamine pyrophosphate-binding protein [Bacteroidetes bacterium]|nr:thiamine pyrophosphate-binding protein [Bacteroidota bacterium]
MIKVSDFVATYLKNNGVEHVFMVTGGGAMHLNDSLGRELKYICNHHEQACAIAAEGYARTVNKLAVVNVTTGPGGLNALNGVMGQWTDSVPVLYLSGQVKFETTIHSCPEVKGLRQLGDQEVDIIKIVSPITKMAHMITDANDVKYYLQKAIHEATTGRPGPVWLDFPMNIQGALVDETTLREFKAPNIPSSIKTNLTDQIKLISEKLKTAKRPVILAGHGVRISGALKEFYTLLATCDIPVVTTFNGIDIIDEEHKNYIGRFGTLGNRAGNFTVQNADVLITIGTRNNIRQVSYNWEFFAREAYKIVVDVDEAELKKPTLKPDLPVCSDAKTFILELINVLGDLLKDKHTEWLKWAKERKVKYPSVLPEYHQVKDGVHPYVFMELLGKQLPKNSVCVTADGTACVAPFQAMPIHNHTRIFWNSGCASMGYDLPAAIGACVANDFKDIICLAGDGSLQMNIQELQTVIHHQMPIKLIYLNNDGYVSIKQTQDGFFAGHRVGSDPKSGVSFPDILKLGAAYGFKTHRIHSHNNLTNEIDFVLNQKGPIICEVMLTNDYKFFPKVASKKLEDGRMISAPLEDLAPFMDREEFRSNLFIKEFLG